MTGVHTAGRPRTLGVVALVVALTAAAVVGVAQVRAMADPISQRTVQMQ